MSEVLYTFFSETQIVRLILKKWSESIFAVTSSGEIWQSVL